MEVRHNIKVVANRTGMSPHLIRMWERRYAAIEPDRTDTGRRLYSDENIERLILLKRATMEGHAISQVANLTNDQLMEMLQLSNKKVFEDKEDDKFSVEYHLNHCLQAMKALDPFDLESRLLRASVSLGQSAFLDKLLHPLLELTGEMWSDGKLKVAHEHLASAVVRSLLGTMYISSNLSHNEPLFISTTPVGQHHEFGALMASVTAATSGWKTLYLGSNMPVDDIISTAKDRRADAIGLSIVYPLDDPKLIDELSRLHKLNDNQLPLIIGGRSAASYDKVLSGIGAIRIESLAELKTKLNEIKKNIYPMN